MKSLPNKERRESSFPFNVINAFIMSVNFIVGVGHKPTMSAKSIKLSDFPLRIHSGLDGVEIIVDDSALRLPAKHSFLRLLAFIKLMMSRKIFEAPESEPRLLVGYSKMFSLRPLVLRVS